MIDATKGHASGLVHPETESCKVWKCKPVTVCHHCGKQILWNAHVGEDGKPNGKGHWAHPITSWTPAHPHLAGKTLTLENAHMEQQCYPQTGRLVWATPKRNHRGQ